MVAITLQKIKGLVTKIHPLANVLAEKPTEPVQPVEPSPEDGNKENK